MGQHVVCKFSVLRHAPVFATHTHMCFVNAQTGWLGQWFSYFESVLLGRLVKDRVKQFGVVLNHKAGPSRVTVHLLTITRNLLDSISKLERDTYLLSVWTFNSDFVPLHVLHNRVSLCSGF